MYFLFLLVPALYITIWHFFDNSLPTSDGGGFFFRSVTNYANLFLDKDNFFESGIRYLSDIICCRGMKPTLFPAIGSPFILLSFGNWDVAYALMGIFYISLVTIYSYLIILEFTQRKNFSIVSAIIIGTLPAVFSNAIANFAEIGLIAFLLPALYYLYKSNYFSEVKYSKYFAISMTLALSIRPVQGIIILILPIFITLVYGRLKKTFSNENLITVFYMFLIFMCVILYTPYLRYFGEPVYISHLNSGTNIPQINFLTNLYFYLTCVFSLLLAVSIFIIIYTKKINTFYKSLSYKFRNFENFLLPTFLLIFSLNALVWAFQFNDLLNWVYGATFGSSVEMLPSLNAKATFFQKITQSISANGFYTFYFTLITLILFLFLNKSFPKRNLYIGILVSSLVFPIITLFGAQTASVRYVPAITITIIIFLILLGNLKKYSKLSFSLLFLFILFKSFIFFDHSINLKFADENLYSLGNTKFSPSLKNVFPIKVDPVKDATLHALDLLREYHKTYKFNKVYVDGSSRLTGKYGLDPHKMISLARFKNAPFRVGDVNVPKYNENSYKMIEEQGYDFIFLANPLLHDDGSNDYKEHLEYRFNCFINTDDCNISPGSLDSFRMYLDIVIKINNGKIKDTNWELIETIRHYNYDVFVMKLKN